MSMVSGETRYYCDRCKREIRKDMREARIGVKAGTFPIEFAGFTSWDLCPECYKEVIRFIKGEDGQPTRRTFLKPWRFRP